MKKNNINNVIKSLPMANKPFETLQHRLVGKNLIHRSTVIKNRVEITSLDPLEVKNILTFYTNLDTFKKLSVDEELSSYSPLTYTIEIKSFDDLIYETLHEQFASLYLDTIKVLPEFKALVENIRHTFSIDNEFNHWESKIQSVLVSSKYKVYVDIKTIVSDRKRRVKTL